MIAKLCLNIDDGQYSIMILPLLQYAGDVVAQSSEASGSRT